MTNARHLTDVVLGRAHPRPHCAQGKIPLVRASQLDHRSEIAGQLIGKEFSRLNLLDAEHGDRPHAEDAGDDSEAVMDRPTGLPQSSLLEGADTEGNSGVHGSANLWVNVPLPLGQLWNGQ